MTLIDITFYFFALVGWGMSATSSPHANAGELLMLAVAPCLSLAAIVKLFAAGKIKPLKAVGLFVPGLLSLAEVAFMVLLWNAG